MCFVLFLAGERPCASALSSEGTQAASLGVCAHACAFVCLCVCGGVAVCARARALVHAPKIAVLFIARACAMTDRRLDRHLMGICHMFATYTAMHRYVFDIEPACCMWLCVCARVPWYCIVSIVWVSCFIGTGIVLYRIVSVLYCIVLYCIVPYRIVSYRIGIVLYCIVSYRIVF